MSIADKLTQVAENQQAVYNAGYAEGAKNGSGTTDHSVLTNRDLPDAHPMSAITGLEAALANIPPGGGGGNKWDLLVNKTIEADCVSAAFSTGDNNEVFSDYNELIVLVDLYGNSGGIGTGVKVSFENTNPWAGCYSFGLEGFAADSDNWKIGLTWCRKTEFGIVPVAIYRSLNYTSRSYEMATPDSLTNTGQPYFTLPVVAKTHLTNTTKLTKETEFKCCSVGGYQAVLGAGTIIRVYGCK